MVTYKSKFPVQFSTINTTEIFNEVVYGRIDEVSNNIRNTTIKGEWYFLDSEGNKKHIRKINLVRPTELMNTIQDSLGPLTKTHSINFDKERVIQIYPMIVDQQHAEKPADNYGLTSADIELVVDDEEA